MRRWFAPAIAGIAILAGIIWFYQSASFSSRSGDDAPLYSVRRHDPYGTAALQDLLAERGIPVRTLERPTLEPGDHGTLIQVLPSDASSEYARYRVPTQQLVDWIAQGNTVVQLTRATTGLMTHYKILPSTQPSTPTARTVEAYEASGGSPDDSPAQVVLARCVSTPAIGDGRLLMWSPMSFENENQPAGWKPLARLRAEGNAVVAGEFQPRFGKLVIIGAPTPALNATLDDERNLDFLLSLVGNGPVILDEWSHGLGHEATVLGFLHDAGLLPVLVQLVFLAVIYVWSTSGVPRSSDQLLARERSSIEQVQTLGFLYSRSLSPEIAFNRINTEVTRRLAEALRCPPAEIVARSATLKPELKSRFDELLARLAQSQPPHAARCQNCGYDLTKNESGRCPECGAAVSVELRRRIADASTPAGQIGEPNMAARQQRRTRLDSVLADVLSLSHQLSREVQRDRGLVR